MGEIFINLSKARAEAEAIEDLGGRVEDLAKGSFADSMEHIAAGWKGDSAGRYLEKGARLQEYLEQTGKDIRILGGNIRRAAAALQAAEERAKELAGG